MGSILTGVSTAICRQDRTGPTPIRSDARPIMAACKLFAPRIVNHRRRMPLQPNIKRFLFKIILGVIKKCGQNVQVFQTESLLFPTAWHRHVAEFLTTTFLVSPRVIQRPGGSSSQRCPAASTPGAPPTGVRSPAHSVAPRLSLRSMDTAALGMSVPPAIGRDGKPSAGSDGSGAIEL